MPFLGSIIQPITITKLDSTVLEPKGQKKEIEAMGLIPETIQEVDVEREERSLTFMGRVEEKKLTRELRRKVREIKKEN